MPPLMQAGFSQRGGLSERDWRIDVWRGLAILMIFVNHLGPNAFAMLTTRHWGFSDAAELFVFLSGISTARVLARLTDAPAAPLRWAIRRAAKLYGYHLALFLALGLMCSCFLTLTKSNALIETLQYAPFFARTEVVLMNVATLTFLPSYADILPLYIVLTVLAGALYTVTGARMGAIFAASLLLYVAARAFGWNLPADDAGRGWFFNPFTWQFLFIAGMAAWSMRAHRSFQTLLQSRAAITLSAVVLGLAVVPAAPWTLDGALPGWRPFTDQLAPLLDKQNLSPLRLIHFLAAAHIGYALLPFRSRLRHTVLAAHLSAVGRHALNMFILASVLTIVALAFDLQWGHSFFRTSLMSAASIALIVICAQRLEAARSGTRSIFRRSEAVELPVR